LGSDIGNNAILQKGVVTRTERLAAVTLCAQIVGSDLTSTQTRQLLVNFLAALSAGALRLINDVMHNQGF
jgi:hypothetical protein